jgi:hypothetical protein
MAYRPGRRKVKYPKNPSGVARIKAGKKSGTLIVWFSEDNDNEFADKKYKVTGWPDFIRKPKKLAGREWYVKLNNDHNEIYSISPQSGMFTGKMEKFISSEGAEPAPELINKTSQEGKPYSYLQFVCIGMEMLYYLRHNFAAKEEDDEYGEKGDAEYTNWGKNSIHTPKLDEFLTVTGAWDKGPIKFIDNLLPKLQKRILKADKSFQFIVKNGWIDTLYVDSSVSDDEDGEEEFPW